MLNCANLCLALFAQGFRPFHGLFPLGRKRCYFRTFFRLVAPVRREFKRSSWGLGIAFHAWMRLRPMRHARAHTHTHTRTHTLSHSHVMCAGNTPLDTHACGRKYTRIYMHTRTRTRSLATHDTETMFLSKHARQERAGDCACTSCTSCTRCMRSGFRVRVYRLEFS